MLIENLSDHARDSLDAVEAELQEASDDIVRAQTEVQEAEAAYRAAGRERPFWKRVLGIKSPAQKAARERAGLARREIQEAQRRKMLLHKKVQQHAAGVQGEDELTETLAARLSDDWLMFRGYYNRRGEADVVLVGPTGVWVIEVKNRNARLSANGEDWTFEKLDRYGNVVKRGDATDGSGRSWGRQAGDVADALTWWLGHNHQEIDVHTAVMLIHERASLATIRNPGVDLVSTSPSELLQVLDAGGAQVSPDTRKAVAHLIRRDHKHHVESRKKAAEG